MTTTSMNQAVELFLASQNGFLPWAEEAEVRTFCHGFLFHYEHLFREKNLIIGGNSPCRHGEECPYFLSYTVMLALMDTPCPAGLKPLQASVPCGEGSEQPLPAEAEGLDKAVLIAKSIDETMNRMQSHVDAVMKANLCNTRFNPENKKLIYGCVFNHDAQKHYDSSWLCSVAVGFARTPFLEKLAEVYEAQRGQVRATRRFTLSRAGRLCQENLPVFDDKIFACPRAGLNPSDEGIFACPRAGLNPSDEGAFLQHNEEVRVQEALCVEKAENLLGKSSAMALSELDF